MPGVSGHPVSRLTTTQDRDRSIAACAGDDRGACRAPPMTASVDIGNVTLTYRGASGGVLALARHDAQRRPRRVRRGGRAVRLRQVVVDEARDRARAARFRRHRHFRRQGARPGQDRRHGVPEPQPAALAQGHRQRAAAARDRASRIASGSAARRRNIASRPARCSRRSGSTASASAFRGSSPAACSSASRSAAR